MENVTTLRCRHVVPLNGSASAVGTETIGRVVLGEVQLGGICVLQKAV